MHAVRVDRGGAEFQVLDALRVNRRKRRQRGEFLVQGVRAIDAARRADWPLTMLVTAAGARRSRWASDVLSTASIASHVELAPELFAVLSEREEPAELIAVAALPRRPLADIGAAGPVVVLDRPAGPGNIGTLIRSADAFGAAGVVIMGHAADPYDPSAVRASVGAIFTVPVVEAGGPAEVAPWLAATERRPLGLDEGAPQLLREVERGGRIAIVLGNEGRGLSSAARAMCDELVAIPMTGTASSLNVAVAGSIALYELAA